MWGHRPLTLKGSAKRRPFGRSSADAGPSSDMADLQRLKSSIEKLERLLAAMDIPELPVAAEVPPEQPVTLGYIRDRQARGS